MLGTLPSWILIPGIGAGLGIVLAFSYGLGLGNDSPTYFQTFMRHAIWVCPSAGVVLGVLVSLNEEG